VEVCIWSVGAMMMSGQRKVVWRRLINGPVVAVTVGLVLVATGLDEQVTGVVRKAMSMIGVGCFPLAILITGCAMIDQVGAERIQWRMMSGAALIRLVLCPAVILCVAKFLPMPTELRQVMVVQAAMPAGTSAIILAKLYGGRPAVAVQVVIATTVLSLFTIPFMIQWGSAWIGLKPVLP
jgi:malate permease and related proteins